ncbi:hypothetical protein OAU50_07895 [Planctomycetota bacterium]|nr:hypothetical protein [Planctomycetota bacterium]
MNRMALFLLGVVAATVCGCATQSRASRVGEVGLNSKYEAARDAELNSQNYYDYRTPKVGVTFESDPEGALVEWHNNDGVWVTVGSTPTEDIVIEATGKPELFRVSQTGYIPQIRWIASLPNVDEVSVKIHLDKDLAPQRNLLGMSK